jgi:hypothetical protein
LRISGQSLSFIQDRQTLARHQRRPFEVETEPLGLLLEVEVSPVEGANQRRLSALPRAHQRHGWKLQEPALQDRSDVAGYHELQITN